MAEPRFHCSLEKTIALLYLADARQTSMDVAVHVREGVGAISVTNEQAKDLSDDVAEVGHTSIDVACPYRDDAAVLPHTAQRPQLSPSPEWHGPWPVSASVLRGQ